MNKIYFPALLLLLLSNCTAPTASLFGPIFTGAKTGSIYQASISYGTNRIINEVKEFNNKKLKDINMLSIQETAKMRMPKILTSYKVAKIDISQSVDAEPLP
tara:strand:+ start:2813 stop:3118 length:306 start_codon:yes stop_codon:yes gene_type:complete